MISVQSLVDTQSSVLQLLQKQVMRSAEDMTRYEQRVKVAIKSSHWIDARESVETRSRNKCDARDDMTRFVTDGR